MKKTLYFFASFVFAFIIMVNVDSVSACALPTVGAISGPSILCTGVSSSFSDSTSGGTWSSSNTSVATVNSSGTAEGVATGSATISYTVTNSCGSTTVTISVTDMTVPGSPATIAGTASACAGRTSTLTDATSGGAWSSSNTSIATVSSGGVVTGVAGGTAVISYSVSNSCGIASAFLTFTVDTGAPTIRITGTDTFVCSGAVLTSLSETGGTGGTWSSSNTSIATVYSGLGYVYGVSAGTVTISYTLTTCATAVATRTVIVGGAAIADFTGTSTICVHDSAAFSDATHGGTWSSSNTSIATVNSSTGEVTGVSAGLVYITYSVSGACGATYVDGEISVVGEPSAGTITGVSTVCATTDITLTVSGESSSGIWSSSNSSIATVYSYEGQVGGVAVGSVTISYSVTNACGTVVTTHAMTVTTGAITVSAINGLDSVCIGSTISLSDTTHGGGGTWSSSTTSYATVSSSGVVTGVGAGTVYITYSVTNSCGTFYALKTIYVGSGTYVGAISGATSICVGGSTYLDDGTSGGTWSSGNASIATVEPYGSEGEVYGVSNGNVEISYSISGTCGTSVAVKRVTVGIIVAAIAGPGSVCLHGTGTYSDDSSGGVWSSSNSSVASISTTGVVSGVAVGTATISYTISGTCGSVSATRATATVTPVTVAAITGASSLCTGTSTTLSDVTPDGIWVSSDSLVASVNSSGLVTGLSVGTTTISYLVINGCGTYYNTTTITVTGGPATPAAVSGASTVCAGASTTLIDGTTGGVWSSTNTSVATISSSGTVFGVAVGSTVISYTVTNGCGPASVTFGVSVITVPSVASISGGATICAGTSTNYTDGTTGGTWSSSNSSIASVNPSGHVTGIAAGSAIISYTVTNSCGPTVVTSPITITTVPAAPHGINGGSSVCPGVTLALTDSTSGGAWTTSNASIASVTTSGLVTGIAAGSATITYTISNSCGSTYVTKNITVIGSPVVGAISGASSFCLGTSTTLTDGTSGGTWSSSNTGMATVNSAGVVTGLGVGSVTISYSVTGACNTTSSTFNMSIITIPSVAAISGSATICNGTSTTLTDATSGGTWSSVTMAVATVNSGGTVFAISAGTTTISYTLTNTCGSAAATKVISVTALPTAGTITGTTTVCTGATTALADGTSGGTWSSSNSSIASVNSSGLVSGVTAGTAVISYLVTTTCGTAMTSIAVTVNPSPNAGVLTGASSVCTGATTNLTNSMGSGSWSSSATAIASVNSGGVVSGIAAGSATISYTVTNSCGTAVATHSITVNSTPSVASVMGPTTVCTGSTITLTDATSGGTWSSSNTAIASVGLTGIVTGLASGSVSISYTWSNMCGSATAGTVINVGGAPSAGSISGPTALCTGNTITLTETATGGVWSSSNTSKATVTSSGIVYGVAAGSVTISYTVTSSCGTVAALSTITVSTSASAGTISGLSSVCTGTTITLTTSGTAGGTWTSSNTSIASVSAGVVHGLSVGTVTISYSVTSGCGTVVSTKSVSVITMPTVTAISGPSNICIGTSTTYTDGTSGGGWISSNTAVATVNSAGLVTAISAGSAILTYFVTNTCGTATTSIPLTVSSLSAGIISGAASVAVGASTTLTNTVTGGVWSSIHTGLATINTTGSVTGVAVGADSIKYSVTNVCGTANAYKIISITAHRDELPGNTLTQGEENTGINIFPNPNSGSFTLELTGVTGEATILITDLTGRTITTKTTSDKSINFDLSYYAVGTYLVRVSVDGKVFGRKIVVN